MASATSDKERPDYFFFCAAATHRRPAPPRRKSLRHSLLWQGARTRHAAQDPAGGRTGPSLAFVPGNKKGRIGGSGLFREIDFKAKSE